MKKASAPIALALVFAVIFSLAACRKQTVQEPSSTVAAEDAAVGATASETESSATTVTSTTLTTTSTTAATTTVARTARVVTTTKKRVTTTKKPATTAAASTKVTTETNSYTEVLKYGVTARVTETVYYNVINGKKVYDRTEKSYVYNRSNYSASNADLEAEAKENRSTYSGYVNDINATINGYREEKGLPALKLDAELTKLASVRAVELAWSDKCSHTRPNGSRCFTIFEEYDITTGIAGENIGWGFTSVSGICEGWRNSPTHYDNIIDDRFAKTGIAVAAGPDGKLYWVQLFHS